MAKPLSSTETLVLVALSLSTDELRRGLDILLTLALEQGTDDQDWDLLPPRFTPYEVACVEAAHAWIKRVTGFDEFTRVTRPSPTQQEKADDKTRKK